MTERPHGPTRYRHGPDEHGNPGKGCRCQACKDIRAASKRHQRRMAAYGRWEAPVDAAGTRRRLQALIWNGWSQGNLAAQLGGSRSAVAKPLRCRLVYPATAARIAALYDRLWDQPPPEGTRLEKGAATKARRYARRCGFAPALAWDDEPGSPHFIDSPAAVPVPGWERGERREHGALTEAVIELGHQQEHPEMIAQRTGASPQTVERTLARAGVPVWRAERTEKAATRKAAA